MKKIDKQQYLIGLGLFTLAAQYQRKAEEAHQELIKFLGLEDGSHVSDAIYSLGSDSFDNALEREEITVEE